MARLLTLAIASLALFCVPETEAQEGRGFFFRRARAQASPQIKFNHGPYRFETSRYYADQQSRLSRILDGPLTGKYRDPAEVDSRYVGGFHQRYFDNIGVPPGDIGIRGNGINWYLW
ncbi:MAG: hypothetical protein AAF939_19200 [Planctomycetota bacterium]